MSDLVVESIESAPQIIAYSLVNPGPTALGQYSLPQGVESAGTWIVPPLTTPYPQIGVERNDGFFVLLDGRVSVVRGRDAHHICDLDAGESLGEVEIIDQSPCAASVVCLGKVEAAVIGKEDLEAFLAGQPRAAIKVLRQMVRVLATRLRATNASYSTLKEIAENMGD